MTKRNSIKPVENSSSTSVNSASPIFINVPSSNRRRLSRQPLAKPPRPTATLTWENVDAHFRDPNQSCLGSLCGRNPLGRRQVLNDVYGIARPHQITAFMGANNSGKKVLLKILNFVITHQTYGMDVSGDIKINGVQIKSLDDCSEITAFVPETEIFIETLKVSELLNFYAHLRINRALSKKEREEKLERLIDEFNLRGILNDYIGVTKKKNLGLTIAERRLVSFVCNLLSDPTILFCEESTNGMDTVSVILLLRFLRKFADEGNTVVMSLNQPPTEAFQAVDFVYFLGEGRIAYAGPMSHLKSYFASNNIIVPSGYYASDYYIKCFSIEPERKDECISFVKNVCNKFDESNFAIDLQNEIIDISEINTASNARVLSAKDIRRKGYRANIFSQIKWLMYRECILMFKNNFIDIASDSFTFPCLLGFAYMALQLTQTNIQNINGVMLLYLLITSYAYMFDAVTTFSPMILMVTKENHHGLYMIFAYYIAKTIVQSIKYLLLPFIFVAISYWLINLYNDVGRFFICCAVVVLTSNVSVAFGEFITSISPNKAIKWIGFAHFYLMIYNGILLNNGSNPQYLVFLQYWSWLWYGNSLLLMNQWTPVTNITCTSSSYCLSTGSDVLTNLNVNTSYYTIDFIVLGGMIAIYKTLTFIILLIRSYVDSHSKLILCY